MAKQTDTPKVPYYKIRAERLRAQHACTLCAQVLGSGIKVSAAGPKKVKAPKVEKVSAKKTTKPVAQKKATQANVTKREREAGIAAGLILEDGAHADSPAERKAMQRGIKASKDIDAALAQQEAQEAVPA